MESWYQRAYIICRRQKSGAQRKGAPKHVQPCYAFVTPWDLDWTNALSGRCASLCYSVYPMREPSDRRPNHTRGIEPTTVERDGFLPFFFPLRLSSQTNHQSISFHIRL